VQGLPANVIRNRTHGVRRSYPSVTSSLNPPTSGSGRLSRRQQSPREPFEHRGGSKAVAARNVLVVESDHDAAPVDRTVPTRIGGGPPLLSSDKGSRASAGRLCTPRGQSRSSGTAPGAPDRRDRRVANPIAPVVAVLAIAFVAKQSSARTALGHSSVAERSCATRRAEGRTQSPGSTSGTRFSAEARLSEPPSGTRAMPRYSARRRPSSPAVCTAAGGRSWPVRRLSHRTARGSLRLAAASGTEGKLTTTAGGAHRVTLAHRRAHQSWMVPSVSRL
jgi:hypothetical protein